MNWEYKKQAFSQVPDNVSVQEIVTIIKKIFLPLTLPETAAKDWLTAVCPLLHSLF